MPPSRRAAAARDATASGARDPGASHSSGPHPGGPHPGGPHPDRSHPDGSDSPRRREERLAAAVEDQAGRCFWCRRAFTPLVPPTTDHVVPRVKGGPSWRENEVAACRRCNGRRGHTAPVEWLEECLRRGWAPDPAALDATLARLDAAIAERGGQRRARPYLHGQRRRLERGVG